MHSGAYRDHSPVAVAVACFWRALEAAQVSDEIVGAFEAVLGAVIHDEHLSAALDCFHSAFDQDDRVLWALQATPTVTQGAGFLGPADSIDVDIPAVQSPTAAPAAHDLSVDQRADGPPPGRAAASLRCEAVTTAALDRPCKRRRISSGSQMLSRASDESDRTAEEGIAQASPATAPRPGAWRRKCIRIAVEPAGDEREDAGAFGSSAKRAWNRHAALFKV